MSDNEDPKDETNGFENDQLDRILKQELDTALKSFKKRLDLVRDKDSKQPLPRRKRTK